MILAVFNTLRIWALIRAMVAGSLNIATCARPSPNATTRRNSLLVRSLVLALLLTPIIARADITIGGFYDAERRLIITEANWFAKLPSMWSAYGFVEAYRNPAQGYPPESNVLFGKAWLMYGVTKDVSIGTELEFGYNNAGMYSRTRPFQPDEFRVIPKLGVSIKLQ